MDHDIAQPVRSFFQNYLTAERNLSPLTVLAYRDTLKLLLSFAARRLRKSCVVLHVEDITAGIVREFLEHLEKERGNCARTRNARLAVIRTFFNYLASLDPRLVEQCQADDGLSGAR